MIQYNELVGIKVNMEQINQLNKDLAPTGFEYNYRQDIFYARRDAWQKEYGYRGLYDKLAPNFNMIFDCEPIKFSYKDKDWMIELWKGQYGLLTGAEVGVYVSEDGKHYQCVPENEELYMGFALKKNDKMLVTRFDKHWWLTSFILGEYSKPKELTLIVYIELKDNEMCLAVINALRDMGYNNENLNVMGNSVKITFKKPFTKQSRTRHSPIAKINSAANKRNCRLYNKYTKEQEHTIDKIEYIKEHVPKLYKFAVKIFEGWRKIVMKENK